MKRRVLAMVLSMAMVLTMLPAACLRAAWRRQGIMKKMKWVLGCIAILFPLCISTVFVRAERDLTPDGMKIYTDEDYYGITEKWDYTGKMGEGQVPASYGNAVDGYRHTEGLDSPYAWAPCNSILRCYTGDGQHAGLSLSGEPYCYRGENFERAAVFGADESHPWEAGAGIQLQLPGMEAGVRLFSIELGVKGNAPRNWKLQYSTDDGATWDDFGKGAAVIEEEDGTIQALFCKVRLPSVRSYEELVEIMETNTLHGEPYDASKDLFRMRVVAIEDGSGWLGSTSGEVCVRQVRLEQSMSVPSDGVLLHRLPECQAIVDCGGLTYNGEEQKPAVVVKDWERNKILQEGTDYTVEYRDNVEAGTATAAITGKGRYYQIIEKEFTIQKAAQGLSGAKEYKKSYGSRKFSLDLRRKAGDGEIKYASSNQKVVTVDKKGRVSIRGTGSAVITVKALGDTNFKGESLKAVVKVCPAKQEVKSLKQAKGKKLTVRWKRDARATGYRIQYSTDKKFRKGVRTIMVRNNRTVSKALPKVSKGKDYYVRVCSYKKAKVNGKAQNLYGAYSAKVKGKLKK